MDYISLTDADNAAEENKRLTVLFKSKTHQPLRDTLLLVFSFSSAILLSPRTCFVVECSSLVFICAFLLSICYHVCLCDEGSSHLFVAPTP